MRCYKSSSPGQIALAILLIMSVVLLISVAVANRTTRDVVQTIETSTASKVFTQAEGSTEKILTQVFSSLKGGEIPLALTQSMEENEEAISYSDLTLESELNVELAVGESAQVVLNGDGYNYEGDIEISWTGQAWIIISNLEKTADGYFVIYRFLTDCNNPNITNGFSPPGACNSEGNSSIVHSVTENTQFVRIMSLNYPTAISVKGLDGDLPAQQFVVTTEAVGKATDIQQNAKIHASTTHLLPPPFLDYALYNGSGSTSK